MAGCYNVPMALQFTLRTLLAAPLAALCSVAILVVMLIGAPHTAYAHQLTNGHGTLVPHQHVYKRRTYGQNFIVGHVAPTRHGHNMIIWSPAPSNTFGSAVPHMHITKPDRQRQLQQQRAPQSSQQIRNLRQLDPRSDRR